MVGIVKRGGQYTYRRRVPRRLRSVIGSREVKKSLGTSDLNAAQKKWQAVHADIDRLFAEAEKAIKNPSVAAYKAVEQWKQDNASRPFSDDNEEAFDSYLTTALERDEDGSRPLDVFQRTTLETLLKRSSAGDSKDNPGVPRIQWTVV
jgi:hypothetical protein